MNELVVSELGKGLFVEPHYIEELGCDGLTAEEIADSLCARVNDVRRKLREHPNEMLKSLKVMITMKVNINGLHYDEFLLSTAAAKFFVARYEGVKGDGYLAYLLGLERSFEHLTGMFLKEIQIDFFLCPLNQFMSLGLCGAQIFPLERRRKKSKGFALSF